MVYWISFAVEHPQTYECYFYWQLNIFFMVTDILSTYCAKSFCMRMHLGLLSSWNLVAECISSGLFWADVSSAASQLHVQIPKQQLTSYVGLWVCYLTFVLLCTFEIKYPPLLSALSEICANHLIQFLTYARYWKNGKYYNLMVNILFFPTLCLFSFLIYVTLLGTKPDCRP